MMLLCPRTFFKLWGMYVSSKIFVIGLNEILKTDDQNCKKVQMVKWLAHLA